MIKAVEGAIPPERIEVGQIWLEERTGRYIKILEREVHDTGPAWTYCNEDGEPEPEGYCKANGHRYYDWFWHYSDIFDFVVWERFYFVR
jgi:hypothetical protein